MKKVVVNEIKTMMSEYVNNKIVVTTREDERGFTYWDVYVTPKSSLYKTSKRKTVVSDRITVSHGECKAKNKVNLGDLNVILHGVCNYNTDVAINNNYKVTGVRLSFCGAIEDVVLDKTQKRILTEEKVKIIYKGGPNKRWWLREW